MLIVTQFNKVWIGIGIVHGFLYAAHEEVRHPQNNHNNYSVLLYSIGVCLPLPGSFFFSLFFLPPSILKNVVCDSQERDI